jgi:hypothetical protein
MEAITDRRDPRHEVWKNAAWIELDACACCYLHKNGNALIYIWDQPPEKNIFLSNLYLDKIIGLRLSLANERTD